MFFVFGWERQTVKKHGPVYKYKCQNCHGEEYWQLFSKRKWLTLFYIPIMPYYTEHILICPTCEHGVKINNAKFNELKAVAHCNMDLINNKITMEEHSLRLKQLKVYSAIISDDNTFVKKTEIQLNYLKQVEEAEKARLKNEN